MSAAITAAVVGVAGTAYNQNQAKKAQKKAQEDAMSAAGSGGAGAAGAAGQQSRNDIEWVNNLNRQNAQWAQQQNAVNQTTDFGSTNYDFDPVTGKMTAKQSLAPEQQAMLGALRGQQSEAIGGMDSNQFDVNNDVMNAYRARQQPLIDQQRNKENARLAAMGLGTGSGSAWGTAQDALNRNQVDADAAAIGEGNKAWLAGQQNNRANLGALNSTEQSWAGMAPSLAPPQVAATTVAQPLNKTFEGWTADQALAQQQYENAQDTNSMNARGNQNIWGALGGALTNKDLTGAVTDWWNSPSGNGGGGAAPAGGGAIEGGYGTGGTGSGSYNSMSGFYTDPWAGGSTNTTGWGGQ